MISIPLPRLGDRKHNSLYKCHKPSLTMTDPLFTYPFSIIFGCYYTPLSVNHRLLCRGYRYALFIFRCTSITSNDYVRIFIRDKYIDLFTIIIYHIIFFIVLWYKTFNCIVLYRNMYISPEYLFKCFDRILQT